MIEEYRFGLITVFGRTYHYDVEVRWTGEVLKWWRNESHLIELTDLERCLKQNPETIVIGTGESGMAKVESEVEDFLSQRKIKLFIAKTGEAVRIFNDLGKEIKKIGLFHLTC